MPCYEYIPKVSWCIWYIYVAILKNMWNNPEQTFSALGVFAEMQV